VRNYVSDKWFSQSYWRRNKKKYISSQGITGLFDFCLKQKEWVGCTFFNASFKNLRANAELGERGHFESDRDQNLNRKDKPLKLL